MTFDGIRHQINSQMVIAFNDSESNERRFVALATAVCEVAEAVDKLACVDDTNDRLSRRKAPYLHYTSATTVEGYANPGRLVIVETTNEDRPICTVTIDGIESRRVATTREFAYETHKRCIKAALAFDVLTTPKVTP